MEQARWIAQTIYHLYCQFWYFVAMKFQDAVQIVSDEPLFETGLLLAGNVDPADVRRQLSRWTRNGRVHQLRRGLYVLAPPWRKQHPHPFLVANRLAPGSYVSGLSALAFASVISEYVAEVTSITPGRPGIRATPLGRFSFRHLKGSMMFGYRLTALGQGQVAFVAEPEKAILDVVHLHPGGDDRSYIEELRLDFDALRPDRLEALAAVAGTPKLARAARVLRDIVHDAPALDTL